MSHEYNNQKRTPEMEKDFSIESSDVLAVDGLREVSMERRRQAAFETYGDDLDFERSQLLETEVQQAWPFVSMYDVASWPERSEQSPGSQELVSGKYITQAPPDDDESKKQLLYGIYRQAWERVYDNNEDLDAWTVLRWCLENDLKNRCVYHEGSRGSGSMVFYEDIFGNYGWEHEKPGSPTFWSTEGNVNFALPDFKEAREDSIEARSVELEEYKKRVERRDSNMDKIVQLDSVLYSSLYLLDENSEVRKEVMEYSRTDARIVHNVRRQQSGHFLHPHDLEQSQESMRGDFSDEVARGEALYEKVQTELEAKDARRLEEERLRQADRKEWMLVKEEELQPILERVRTRHFETDENGKRYERLDELTDEVIQEAEAIKLYAEKAVDEAGLDSALSLLQAVQNAPYGRARRLSDIAEYLPNLATEYQYSFSRARDLDMYLDGAINWLKHMQAEELSSRQSLAENTAKEASNESLDENIDYLMQQLKDKYNSR